MAKRNAKNTALCMQSDEYILKKCAKSNQLEMHICHAGLCDAAMPVVKDGLVVGYLIMGRIRLENSRCAFGDQDEELVSLYNELPLFNDEKIESIKTLLPNILFDNAIEVEYSPFISKISDYIKENLDKELSVEELCEKFHVSKNYLYRAFHHYYDQTVNDYITAKRIRKAEKLILATSAPIYKIAEDVGVKNYTYFCKLFKRMTGFTPTEFRKRK
jgi:YesN/AraC family two-component response regulator